MATDNLYGEIDNKSQFKSVFLLIRQDVEAATSRDMLSELYRRAGYLVTLAYSDQWQVKFSDQTIDIRETANEEFAKTVRKINKRARQIGTDADYEPIWDG